MWEAEASCCIPISAIDFWYGRWSWGVLAKAGLDFSGAQLPALPHLSNSRKQLNGMAHTWEPPSSTGCREVSFAWLMLDFLTSPVFVFAQQE